jgi:ABC-type amino acid transport system permease subunit
LRWKLLIATSLVAVAVGAGGSTGLIHAVLYYSKYHPLRGGWLFTIFYLEIIPLAVIIGTSIFVYRHTARRRKLQAVLTGLVALILIHLIAIFTWPVTLG